MALLRVYSSRKKSCVWESPIFPASAMAERNKHNNNECHVAAGQCKVKCSVPFTSDVSTSTESLSSSSFDDDNVSITVVFPKLEIKNKEIIMKN